jgi:hypothetical protein
MAVFLGYKGNIRLRRGAKQDYGQLADRIGPDDVNTYLNRLGFSTALDNLLTGDRLEISTQDPRGLVCFPASAWDSATVETGISAYVNVNGAGGLRFFNSFEDAVNNVRANEIALYAFTGEPLDIEYTVRDLRANVLGNVTGYTFNSDRETLEVTTLSDKFKKQYNAGLISGGGSIDCLFDYESTGIKETPLLMLQLIQRVDIGSEFDLALYVTDSSLDASVDSIYYEMTALVTRAGITLNADSLIECSIDFVTTGEVRLLIGEPAGYILKEDDDRIRLQQSVDFLLQEVDD